VKTRPLLAATAVLALGIVVASWSTRPENAGPVTAAELAAEPASANGGVAPQATPSAGAADGAPAPAAAVPAPAAGGPKEDLLTYAFASADVIALSDTTLQMAELSRLLAEEADSGDTEGIDQLAAELRIRAREATRRAREAIARMEPRAPASGLLAQVRENALGAYRATIRNAKTGSELADFATSLDPADGPGLWDDIMGLRSGPDLASLYEGVAAGLDAWAVADPDGAARALKLFP
jgi:hypothetical protein